MKSVGKRINFDIIYTKYKNRGKGNVRLTQSNLFLTQPIDATKSAYTFKVLENDSIGLQPNEIRLNLNDEFIITAMQISLVGTQSQTLDGKTVATTQILTYAPIELDGQAIKVKGLYAGKFKIAVNNIVYMEKWAVRKHEFIPQTQIASFIGGVPVATQPNIDYSQDGIIAIEPMLTLSGAKKNELLIELPEAIAPTTLSFIDQKGNEILWNVDRIGITLFGLNGQNAALFQ